MPMTQIDGRGVSYSVTRQRLPYGSDAYWDAWDRFDAIRRVREERYQEMLRTPEDWG